jgi:hypothetical protein
VSNEKILNSFEVKNELNPKFWDKNKKLNPQVRERLLKIAQEFIDFISVPIVVEDILFIGSLTNYGWSEYSDIDLHVSIDFNQFPKENLELIGQPSMTSREKLIDFGSGIGTTNEAINAERELLGTGLDFKQIGKVKNDIGGFDYVVKPRNIKPKIDTSTTLKVLPGSPNSAQYQIRGLTGTSTKTGLTEENVAAAIEREKQWIQSDEYIRRRAANTGETVEQIKADVAKILSTAEDARFNLNANITAQGQMTPKSLFNRVPGVEVAKHAYNPINTLEHETGHLYSPSIHGQTDAALHKGMLEADVASLPASEKGVYANYPTLGKGFDKTSNAINLGAEENYLNLGYEQQVRHLNARADILKANNLPLEAHLTEAEVKPFVDTWAEKMSKLVKDPKNPDLLKGEMDYDELWLQEALKIREGLLKEYGVAVDSELTAAQRLVYKQRTREELTKVITDVLNKAWVAVPAIGVGAAMQQKKRGGAVNAISKYKNKFASKVNNDLPIAQDLGTFKRKPLTQTKLNIPAEFQNNTQLDAWVGMPQQSGLGDFTTHRVPSIYDAVRSGNPSSMEEAVDKYFGYPQDRAFQYVDSRQEGDNDPSDNERHAAAGLFTQQAVKDKIGIPVIGDVAGWFAANAMGIGHELGTIFEDERPWGDKLQEGFFEDPVNNLLGTTLGLFPGSQDEKLNVIHNLSVGNWLPDGVVDPNGQNNLYFKDEQGNATRWSPQEMYNNMFSKKQGGLQKAKTRKDKGFQILTDANGKYVFVKT